MSDEIPYQRGHASFRRHIAIEGWVYARPGRYCPTDTVLDGVSSFGFELQVETEATSDSDWIHFK
jgi:hypothetical protein